MTLLKHFAEFGEYVEITGFSNVQIENVEGFLKATRREQQGTAVQFFNAELVATWQHLYFVVLNALTAFRNKTNVSKSVAVEVILYASAQRQIRKAIELLGVKRDSDTVAVVIIAMSSHAVKAALSKVSKRIGSEPDETVLALSNAKIRSISRAFSISEREVETIVKAGNVEQALVDLVVERVALLATQL